jgi:hypothetical protein
MNSRAALNTENVTSETSAPILGAASHFPAHSSPTIAVISNPPAQAKTRTTRAEDDAASATIVAERPRFAGATMSVPAKRKAAQRDLQLDKAISSVRDYRSALKQNPVGSNSEITRALLGKNSRGTRYLPSDVKINDKGELTDRWDQPIFFHQISGALMEIRSAGPDHIMWTKDDAISR